LTALSQKEPDYVSSYALLDAQGINVADSVITDVGQSESGSEYFKQVMADRQSHVSTVQYSPLLNRSVFYISTPVIGNSGDLQGVIRVRYLGVALDHILDSSKGLAGSGSYAILVDENSIHLSHPQNPGLVFKSVVPLDETLLAQLKAENRLPDKSAEELSINLPGLKAALDRSLTKPFFTTEMESRASNDPAGRSIEQGAIVDLQSRPWRVIYTVNQASFLAPIEAQTRTTTLLGLLIGGLAALGGLVMAQVLAAPISRLTEIARQVAAGNFSVQAPVESSGELGTLAKAFNAMTGQLVLTLEGLEQRIAERTQQVEHRARQLNASAEVSSAIANIRVLDELLPKITQLISEQFNFYHVGIFLMDPAGEYAVLRAANSDGGKRMLERSHKLKVGEVGIVGYATGHKEPRIAMDVGQDAVYFDNPDLPETRSELALPLMVGDRVLGALDVQSKEPGAFNQEDVTTLQLLADQVAIAIDNARLFSESQAAVEATRRAYGELSREAWAKMMHEKPEISAIANLYDVTYTPTETWTSEMVQAVQSGNTVQGEPGTIAIPIRDREHNLGILRLRKPAGLSWAKDEINLAQTLAQQLYLALENARLYRETQRRAERERLAGDITAKMRLSNDPQVILQTAVHELRQALNLRTIQTSSSTTADLQDDESDNGHKGPGPA
jgi:GAF domain-containing protein/HAMP domain-containing protein